MRGCVRRLSCLVAAAFLWGVATSGGVRGEVLPTDDGYRGIWYYNQPSKDEYKFKYSGGLATYPQQHAPIAIYRPEVEKTFFVYGGTTARAAGDKQELLHMVSYYDHQTGEMPRPRILLNKKTNDAHDNPVLSIDDAGFLWIFSPSHGRGRPSFIHKSVRPYDIAEFEKTYEGNFSYPQPWYLPGEGFLFLHTHYGDAKKGGVRGLYTQRSGDGVTWEELKPLANIGMGDYQISWPVTRGAHKSRVGTAFDFHPKPLGLNGRANVYYLQTDDAGETWQDVRGENVSLPLLDEKNPALIYDSRAENLLVYLKDLNFDAEGRPVILFLTSRGFESGPENGPRTWWTLRWTGEEWERRAVTTSNSNYDHGSLYIEDDRADEAGTWRVIAPTEAGGQPYNPGGEMVMWRSNDQGATWERVKALTEKSGVNHTYARRPLNAAPEFYALWADGNAREASESRLYFCNQAGEVRRLPERMEGESAKPDFIEN